MNVASATKVLFPSWSCFSLHTTCISTPYILESPLSQLVCLYIISMAPTTTDIVVFAVWLTWTCLSLTPAALKNGVYALVFPTSQQLEQLVLGSLTFAPGLLDVLQSKTSPTTSYFRSLPLYLVKIWGVYLLVLEKPSHRPKVYIGSSTEGRSGLCTRMSQYDRGVNLPIYVRRALDDRYTISYKGLLCWSPLPTGAEKFPLHALFLAVEAAFSLFLDYGISQKGLWHASSLPLVSRYPGIRWMLRTRLPVRKGSRHLWVLHS
jgi:hypothetical protein